MLPNTHSSMHGSSSVPQDLQDVINAYGGKMPQTYGVPVEKSSAASRMVCARSISTPITGWR